MIKPKSCPCCGNKDLYIGHMSVMSMGVHCHPRSPYSKGCGLNVCRTAPHKAIRGIRTIEQMDRYLLEKAIEAWNKRI